MRVTSLTDNFDSLMLGKSEIIRASHNRVGIHSGIGEVSVMNKAEVAELRDRLTVWLETGSIKINRKPVGIREHEKMLRSANQPR